MNKTEFIEQVQEPYKDLWKILVIAQQASVSKSQEVWDMFGREAERYCKLYPDKEKNPFGYRCGQFLLDAAEDIQKMNEGDKK